MIGSIWTVFLFEWRRAWTIPRMAWSALLAFFPIFIVGLMRYTSESVAQHGDDAPPREVIAGFLFALVPMLVSMLGTFLWTTPAISAELEQRSWVYLAVRPHGSSAVLLGKYLAAVTWVIPPAIFGLSVAVPLADSGDGWRIWGAMVRLVLLSCPAYGALYLLLGAIMPRRAMVLAVAYTLIFELVISFIPAVVNKLTVQYRLRALFVRWCDIPLREADSGVIALIGDAPPWQHVAILFLLTPLLLAFAIFVLRCSEFSSSAESDV